MIRYNLRCKDGYEFEAWFRSSADYDDQEAGGKLLCPLCGARKVEKAIMAPALAGTKKSAQPADELKQMRQFMSGMRNYVERNADYVGKEFPEEARKIHYGEVEHRHIYGEASLDEAKDLIEEGVEIAPLPPNLDEEAN